MSSRETRRIVDNALKEFRATTNPDNRLICLQRISQLIEDTTDDELYELAAAVAVEKDHRLRGEICYAISRSRRPRLVEFLRGMARDESPYVRHEAMTAIGAYSGISEAMFAVIDSIMGVLNEIRSTVTGLKNDLAELRNNMVTSDSAALRVISRSGIEVPIIADLEDELTEVRDNVVKPAKGAAQPRKTQEEIIFDDRMRCWETYLRHERELLRDHRGKYVAIYAGEIVGIDESDETLAKLIYDRYGSVEALICKIEEEDGKPIQMPPPREVTEL